jgi:hypothetical protein
LKFSAVNQDLSQNALCAFCGTKRKLYLKKHIGYKDALILVVLSVGANFLFWSELDARALVFFALGLTVSEVAVSLRWRLSLRCSQCGFDPLTYLKTQRLACEQVRLVLNEKKGSPLLGDLQLLGRIHQRRRLKIESSKVQNRGEELVKQLEAE